MVTRRLIVAATLVMIACVGTIITTAPDGGLDATVDSPSSDVSGDIVDAGADSAWWFSQFDVYQWDGADKPLLGEYPLGALHACGGDKLWLDAYDPNECDPLAFCDIATGWCCSGAVKPGDPAECMCGYDIGCLPPNVCCNLPDAQVPSCVDGMAACPNGSRPWVP